MTPLTIAEDRGMIVPSGNTVRTGYARVDGIVMDCRDRMAIGDVERAMQRRMAAAPGHPWPCPVGEWKGETFHLKDGRHEYIAALMLGCDYILVAWIAD